MKAPYKLLQDKDLIGIIHNHTAWPSGTVAMAMELLEYRMHYGPLGCESLDAESVPFTNMKKG